jgi:hypothetical protein
MARRASPPRRPSAWLCLLLLALLPAGVAAQAPPLLLQLRPHLGDTLRVRIDQTIEIARGDHTGGPDDPEVTELTSLVMLARIAVEGSDAQGATLLALTDSVRITSPEPYESSPVLRAAQALQGQRFRFRVAPDGETLVGSGDAWATPAVGSLLNQLPATLPRDAVAPGATWARAVEIPLGVTADGRATATLSATFRFDSLSRSGEFAFLSLRGRLVRSGPLQGTKGGFVQTTGSVTGTLLVDRRRGWITDAHTTISVRSLLSPQGVGTPPLRVRTKITQWMRVM